ncbi:MAG: cell division protein FtsQ/DivIB [Coraliomargaritaceae bacterium]
MIGHGKGKGETGVGGSQSWRELAGVGGRRVKSPWVWKRRMRLIMKLLGGLAVLGFFFAAGYWVWLQAADNEEPMGISAPAQPLERILFQTDGVLPNQWLSRTVDLKIGVNLMLIDIYDLKDRLEKVGQVRSATVERVFPNALRITVKEHVPVLRLVVQSKDGTIQQQIVADDGTVYEGIGYTRRALKRLPYLQPFLHGDGSHLPLLGIPKLAELLRFSQREYPTLWQMWEVVSLEHYSGDARLPGQVIELRTKLVPRILFGANKDFALQLKRLDYILKKIEANGNPSVERIDLSLRGLAAVQFSSKQVNILQ